MGRITTKTTKQASIHVLSSSQEIFRCSMSIKQVIDTNKVEFQYLFESISLKVVRVVKTGFYHIINADISWKFVTLTSSECMYVIRL